MESFYQLTPEAVLAALESEGFSPTGRILQLNSYENRVFEIPMEDAPSVVTKFYRPNRWSRSSLEDEHLFLAEIEEAGFKTACPLKLKNGTTISEVSSIFWAAFPKIQGRLIQELLPRDLERAGRKLALLHNIGAREMATHRPTLNSENFGDPALDILGPLVSPELWSRYEDAATAILEALDDGLEDANFLRIHGDCHRGNLLDSGDELFFVDFDDFCNGPVAQDLWMLTAGDETERVQNLDALLKGYEEFRHFDSDEEDLFEPLRGLRMLHYSAWIARRWEDPSFPKLFPTFGSYNYWSEETEQLERVAWNL